MAKSFNTEIQLIGTNESYELRKTGSLRWNETKDGSYVHQRLQYEVQVIHYKDGEPISMNLEWHNVPVFVEDSNAPK